MQEFLTKVAFYSNFDLRQNEKIEPLDFNPKDLKFSGCEGLIHRDICSIELKTKIICSGLQGFSYRQLSHFMLTLDCESSV